MIENWLFGITSALAESAGTAAAAPAAEAGAEEMAMSPVAAILQMVLPLVLMGVVFYFMLIRPQRKKDKKVKEMLDNLKHGDRVTTIGGIYGTIMAIKDINALEPCMCSTSQYRAMEFSTEGSAMFQLGKWQPSPWCIPVC